MCNLDRIRTRSDKGPPAENQLPVVNRGRSSALHALAAGGTFPTGARPRGAIARGPESIIKGTVPTFFGKFPYTMPSTRWPPQRIVSDLLPSSVTLKGSAVSLNAGGRGREASGREGRRSGVGLQRPDGVRARPGSGENAGGERGEPARTGRDETPFCGRETKICGENENPDAGASPQIPNRAQAFHLFAGARVSLRELRVCVGLFQNILRNVIRSLGSGECSGSCYTAKSRIEEVVHEPK